MSSDVKYPEIEQFVREHAGQRLPGERELTERFGISRPRLRGILQVLEREGLIQRRQGSGTYALAPQTSDLSRAVLLVDASLRLGDDPFFSLVVERLQSGLQAAGAECVIHRTDGSSANLPPAEGVIALGVVGLQVLDRMGETRCGVGLFASATARPGRQVSLLELDDYGAGREAARRLVQANVRQVFFFGRRALPAVGDRLAGAEEALYQAGLPLDVVECGLNYTAGLEQGSRFTNHEYPVGIVAANDWLAIGLHTGLQSQHPELRRRVVMVSFDGLPLTRHPGLGIASLAVPLEAMAVDAVAELQRLQRPGAVGRSIRYPLSWEESASE